MFIDLAHISVQWWTSRVPGVCFREVPVCVGAYMMFTWVEACRLGSEIMGRMFTEMEDISLVLMVLPALYFIFRVSDYMIGESVRRSLKKIQDTIRIWLDVLCIVLFLSGWCIKLGSLGDKHLLDLKLFNHEGLTILLACVGTFLVTLSVLVVGFVMFAFRYGWPQKIAAACLVTPESDHELLDDIMKSLRKQVQDVRNDLKEIEKEVRKSGEDAVAFPAAEKRQKVQEEKMPSADDVEAQEKMVVESVYTPEERICYRCGGTDHRSVQCAYNKLHCNSCGLRGHKANRCKNTAYKDSRGRVNTRVEDRPGSVRLYQRRDRSKGQALDTAGDILDVLHDTLKEKAKKEKKRREASKENKKQEDEGKGLVEPTSEINEVQFSIPKKVGRPRSTSPSPTSVRNRFIELFDYSSSEDSGAGC
eukprot:GHVQ01035190.1.p1 GENE.GHVQ01035190.1~~GHVQ01035190.1.p1  ORF type:complete len:419 (-),score=38.14 GHVQ01035190.1:157-1413(-)